jgi:hypothetical protein
LHFGEIRPDGINHRGELLLVIDLLGDRGGRDQVTVATY